MIDSWYIRHAYYLIMRNLTGWIPQAPMVKHLMVWTLALDHVVLQTRG